MSKASEYVERLATRNPDEVAPERPLFVYGGHTYAAVNSAGQLQIVNTEAMPAGRALAYARWIQDTFGDANVEGE